MIKQRLKSSDHAHGYHIYSAHTPQDIKVRAQLSMLLLDVEALAVAHSSPRVLALNITTSSPFILPVNRKPLSFLSDASETGYALAGKPNTS
jgi:hypothetical protein